MIINIAFNTIIYIMVFLFPGVLFRRAFFSGKFNKHFDSGNSFERVLWGLFTSIVCIFLYCLFIDKINYYSDNALSKVLDMKKEDVFQNFISIYENKFPIAFSKTKSLSEIFYVLASLYFFSGLLGIFFNKIFFIFSIDKSFSFFKFQHQWDYLTVSNKHNNSSHKLGDIHYTKVDIKTNDEQLFTGRLHEVVLDKDGKVEAVAIRDTYKFYKLDPSVEKHKIDEIKKNISKNNPSIIIHIQSESQFIYRKRIKGDIFTIPNSKVENISITFIKISHILKKFQRITRYFVSTLLLCVTVFSISYAIWDYHIIDFDNIYKRIAFCFFTPLVCTAIIILILSIFNKNVKNRYYILVWSFIFLLYVSIPYLYIFSYTSLMLQIFLLIIYFIFMVFISPVLSRKLIKDK